MHGISLHMYTLSFTTVGWFLKPNSSFLCMAEILIVHTTILVAQNSSKVPTYGINID